MVLEECVTYAYVHYTGKYKHVLFKSNVLPSKPSDRFDRLILIMLHDWSINFMLIGGNLWVLIA